MILYEKIKERNFPVLPVLPECGLYDVEQFRELLRIRGLSFPFRAGPGGGSL